MIEEYELIVRTACCQRNRVLSRTVYTVWGVGTVLFGSFRCRDDIDCAERENEAISLRAAPFWKVLAN